MRMSYLLIEKIKGLAIKLNFVVREAKTLDLAGVDTSLKRAKKSDAIFQLRRLNVCFSCYTRLNF